MDRGVPLGRVAGIALRADWSVLLIVWLITSLLAQEVLPSDAPGHTQTAYWSVAAVTAVVFFGCLLLHELAHALVATSRGLKVDNITLWMLGGVTRIEGENKLARDELRMAAAGPATSAAIGAALLLISPSARSVLPEPGGAAVRYLGDINLLLAGFNLLPAFPLDGGRVLRAWLWRRWGDRLRATLRAADVGRLLGGLMIALGGLVFVSGFIATGIWYALIGWFITTAARQEALYAIQQHEQQHEQEHEKHEHVGE